MMAAAAARSADRSANGCGVEVLGPGRGRIAGICVTCNEAPECPHLLRNPGLVVWHCENFDDSVRSHPAASREPVVATAEPVDPRVYRGLCADCANRESCISARPEGGVWHCNEYR